MLICDFFLKRDPDNRKVLYVVPHKVLKKEVEDKLEFLPDVDVQVILDSELYQYIDLDYVFVVDEFYHSLIKTPVRFTESGGLPPIMELCLSGKSVLSTGHRSKETMEFLNEVSQNEIDIQIN